MKINRLSQSGSTLLYAMCAILIISLIGANVLMNCSTRYNSTTKQVKGWKEALHAAESGGDIAYNDIRKFVSSPGSQFTGTGWTYSSYANGPWTYTAPSWFGVVSNLNTTVTVDKVSTNSQGDGMYRIRAIGNAKVFGLPRVGMNDGLVAGGTNFSANGSTRGTEDSLLRKIDFKFDHFIATYGDGDGNGKTLTAVTSPQVSRRIELMAVPVMPIDAALKATGSFTGPGAAGVVDSYDSKNGAYKGSNPASPYDADAHNGDVAVGTSTFNSPGYIYGNVTTNGGHALPSDCSGVVDNNVPFTVPPVTMPSHPAYQPGTAVNFTPTAASSYGSAPWYFFNSFSNGVINNPSGTNETYANVVVSGDITSSLTVAKGVNVRFYMVGNFSMKGKDFANNNVDGSPVTNPSRAGHIQLYGINPTAPATQTIDLSPPKDFYMMIYAPGADVTMNGNPDLYGAVVCRNWSGNGNTSFHFDKELAVEGAALDYRIASYVEDVR
jgi:hypothetical protein